jgi:isoleucyl-tRNA synthetase
MDPLDRYALDVTSRAHMRVQQAYMDCEFHKMYHTLHNLCVTDLSAFYLDIIKDRLYSSGKTDAARRSAQTALLHILFMLIRDMAPVLSFTAEEVFDHIPAELRPETATVFALQPVDAKQYLLDETTLKRWELALAVRSDLTKAIEPLRRDKVIGHALDTQVTLYVGDELQKELMALGTDLRAMCIVSQLDIKTLANAPPGALRYETPELAITVVKAAGNKCARCWIYTEKTGADANHPDICPRCTDVVRQSIQAHASY